MRRVLLLALLLVVSNAAPHAQQPSPAAAQNRFDQQIVIPSPNRMGRATHTDSDAAGVASGWTPMSNGNDPGQLRVDLTSIRLWRKVERCCSLRRLPCGGARVWHDAPRTLHRTIPTVAEKTADAAELWRRAVRLRRLERRDRHSAYTLKECRLARRSPDDQHLRSS